jgi:hypothetical protein
MLYGIGLTEHDLNKAQVGIVSTGWERELVGLVFNAIGVSDGIANGTEGMRYSLVSRELIADSIEAVASARRDQRLGRPNPVVPFGRLSHFRRFKSFSKVTRRDPLDPVGLASARAAG